MKTSMLKSSSNHLQSFRGQNLYFHFRVGIDGMNAEVKKDGKREIICVIFKHKLLLDMP